jgi:hypothetical protein
MGAGWVRERQAERIHVALTLTSGIWNDVTDSRGCPPRATLLIPVTEAQALSE